ncbi:MAG TPA: enoyl-ACP reductase [Rhodopirellula baltica]|uniref:Enoyl-[acyl-carrier-protein] reductase [NADH] n=1 Tax=Rhodopirellula baltica (strain DSM 10527 / NCIMB 13988 / SH1) TaxID=243090 RepID=Q7UG49_RHOBA|nr:enoyl-ACP reductase [Rhodopirellula baltica]CAD78480.1 trans-2-enoyl-ACP reductase [Rhodopirellula baltica SH 1]HBE61995.1 enoyl-ACP reductase [Rhodopirellula baltica]
MSTEPTPAMDFLGMSGKTFLVMGVANKKSVAFAIAKQIEQAGGEVIYAVRSEARRDSLSKLLADRRLIVCDVEQQEDIEAMAAELQRDNVTLAGVVHSIAFADYSDGIRPFHETTRRQFLQAIDISAFSLVAVCNAIKDQLANDASVVTIGISTTRMASESYGFMAPIKAALESSLAFLTKSFSRFSQVRFNAVAAGLLKTSASAGIPGYVDSYLYAEKVIPRGEAVSTNEVASTAAFLLSSRSSGITAQSIVVDAGMSINYFDADVVGAVTNASVD